ncbi:permease of ABC transporter system [Bifidobacterium panos]|uniref:ABC transporter, ATP-binding protein n=1 Tax=Bifidobacterium panos TaxID=2675321 RepID=A0ABX1SXE1_9BIFI|nr:permease of ABC transporter system [Bifidobacterium sp. DSM 109963]NMN01944.1 ABC transporter, ATP-binding protein [Bifidobacterium sp. DSM 109963]
MSASNASNASNAYARGRRAERTSRHVHLTFGGCLKAELLKLWSLKSTKILLLLNIAFMLGMAALSALSFKLIASMDLTTGQKLAQPQPIAEADIWMSISSAATITALVIGIFGVMAITSEYTTSAVQSSLVANPRRGLFYASKSAALALFSFVDGLIGVAAAYGVVRLMFAGFDITALSGEEWRIMPVTLIGMPVVTAVVALLAQGLGGMTRSTVGGVVSVVVLFMALTMALSLVSMATAKVSWLKWVGSLSGLTPNTAMSTFLSAGCHSSAGETAQAYWMPNWWQAGLVLLAWSVVSWIVGLAVTRRADVK